MAYLVLLALAALDSAGYGILAPIVPEIGEQTGAGRAAGGGVAEAIGFGAIGLVPLAASLLVVGAFAAPPMRGRVA